jgi:hypothetical protein
MCAHGADMLTLGSLRRLALATLLALSPVAAGCGDSTGSSSDDITDVKHTDVERQSIGNCWLYAEASWVESMNLSATGTKFDISQSYWTYWHWYDQIRDGADQIETGGSENVAGDIIMERGVMPEASFIKEDSTSEMSSRQSTALNTIQRELKEGRLKTLDARANALLVRQVLDEAWGLTSSVKGALTKAFGKDGVKTLLTGGTTKYTAIKAPSAFAVQYTERKTDPSKATVKKTTLDVAIDEWSAASYPSWSSDTSKRSFLIRVQKALHDRQPVIVTWDVDFNAMEGSDPVLKGSFNLTTLKKAGGPGRQGGHMVVLEDYQAVTQEFGTLLAGVTLDPNNPDDAAKLAAALLPSTKVSFLRIKNSWGALRDDRSSAPGFPGYHDLYMDYLNGPITWCPDVEGTKTTTNCKGTSKPFRSVVLPPGY